MKRHFGAFSLYFCVFFLFNMIPAYIYGQIGGEDLIEPDLPIDGGLSLLIAAGVGYGVKKYRDERKKNER